MICETGQETLVNVNKSIRKSNNIITNFIKIRNISVLEVLTYGLPKISKINLFEVRNK